MPDTTPAARNVSSRRPPRRYRNPWGVDYRTARRYGYPLVALTPVEALECEVASLTARVEALEALEAGMALLGAGE